MKTTTKILLHLQLAALLVTSIFANSKGSDNEVPFRGSFAGLETQETVPDGFFSILTASGNASHLGRCALLLELHVSADLSSAVATIELIAANGDTLFGEVEGLATPVGPTTLSVEETVTITGGTGRFSNAQGHFIVNRLIDLITGASSGSFEGAITK